MVKDRRRKLDARERQKWSGEGYQTAERAVSGDPQTWTVKRQSALSSTYGITFRDALTEAHKAAMDGDIDAVEIFTRKRLREHWATGIQVATTLVLHWAEFERAPERRLPGLVREVLRDDALGRPLWRRRVNGNSVLMYDSRFPAAPHGMPRPEPAAQLDSRLRDPRVRSLLNALSAQEQAILTAWCESGVSSWSEAASIAGVRDPDRSGDQMRRKIRRLVAKLWEKAA